MSEVVKVRALATAGSQPGASGCRRQDVGVQMVGSVEVRHAHATAHSARAVQPQTLAHLRRSTAVVRCK
jgi:hypothetical protein